jgi:hypothetical protein
MSAIVQEIRCIGAELYAATGVGGSNQRCPGERIQVVPIVALRVASECSPRRERDLQKRPISAVAKDQHQAVEVESNAQQKTGGESVTRLVGHFTTMRWLACVRNGSIADPVKQRNGDTH